MSEALDELLHRADLDGLVRLIDGLTAAREWAELLEVRQRSRTAVTSGRQLWPAATLAEYRLALHAPAAWAAQVLDETGGRFTIGPLTEVVAQTHSLAELAEAVADPLRLGLIAHERALRGDVGEVPLNPLDIPFQPAPWEPEYALATYSDDGVEAPSPDVPTSAWIDSDDVDRADGVQSVGGIHVVEDIDTVNAVRQLFDGWSAGSDGRVAVGCVEGRAADAVAALGIARPRVTPIGLDAAMAWLAWAGASGGANGRRRGAATGRFGVWWLLAQLTDQGEDWPPDPARLGRAAAALRWYWWDTGQALPGWAVQLAVEDPAEGYAWAITAHDTR